MSITNKTYDSVYFIGIGGIGMSALARFFLQQGKRIAGYDRTSTSITDHLSQIGIDIHFDDQVDCIPEYIRPNHSLIVYTPAVPSKNLEWQHFSKNGYTLIKRSALLGELTKNYFTIAVAGTHGKTTISSLIAHILKTANRNVTAFLGGISVNINSNLLIGNPEEPDNIMVIEADEYDRSFLQLHPQMAVVSAMDPDHLDIYGDQKTMIQSYLQFMDQIHQDGTLLFHESIDFIKKKISRQSFSYGIHNGEYRASRIQTTDQRSWFDLHTPSFGDWEKIQLHTPGLHNLENALAAIAIALILDTPMDVIRQALTSYKGVKRRFEYVLQQDDLIYIDDYAHHPVEIKAFLTSLKKMYPNRKLTAVFQPHLYTRTQDFATELSESLSLAHEVIVLDIYPAREEPIPGITSEILIKNIQSDKKMLCQKENLIPALKNLQPDVLATIGAGDIDTLVDPIKKQFEKT